MLVYSEREPQYLPKTVSQADQLFIFLIDISYSLTALTEFNFKFTLTLTRSNSSRQQFLRKTKSEVAQPDPNSAPKNTPTPPSMMRNDRLL